MKLRRIAIAFSIILALSTTLTGCMIIPVYSWNRIEPDTVTSIQIYDLDDNSYEERYQGNFRTTEIPDYTIEEEDKEAFLKDLSRITFNNPIILIPLSFQPKRSYGRWTARINYTDGSYQLISNKGYGGIYDADDNMTDLRQGTCDSEKWNEFIEKYVFE